MVGTNRRAEPAFPVAEIGCRTGDRAIYSPAHLCTVATGWEKVGEVQHRVLDLDGAVLLHSLQ